MLIRKAELKDEEEIIKITDVLFLQIPNFVWNNEKFVEKQIKSGEYFVGEENGRLVGVISLRQRKNGMHIETIAIRDGFAANGFGTELVAFAKQVAKDKGTDTLHAYSFHEYNIVDFYKKQGFELMDYSGSYNGHPYHCLEIKI